MKFKEMARLSALACAVEGRALVGSWSPGLNIDTIRVDLQNAEECARRGEWRRAVRHTARALVRLVLRASQEGAVG